MSNKTPKRYTTSKESQGTPFLFEHSTLASKSHKKPHIRRFLIKENHPMIEFLQKMSKKPSLDPTKIKNFNQTQVLLERSWSAREFIKKYHIGKVLVEEKAMMNGLDLKMIHLPHPPVQIRKYLNPTFFQSELRLGDFLGALERSLSVQENVPICPNQVKDRYIKNISHFP